ncbi:hypothetical protein BSL78_20209 [Apostichopus japonicus]|uniref:Ig-like domain-containing protein n=1 Tax=Stichopus japonicus TaxID=307972 RepID=A0A2G8K4R1_STIJA|nr:hypothetical protein BSL78_20209 [Apostichopus japonicus]
MTYIVCSIRPLKLRDRNSFLCFLKENASDVPGQSCTISLHTAGTMGKSGTFSIAWVVNNVPTLIYASLNPLQHYGERRRPAADQSGSKVYLEISNVTFKDAGSYKCQRYLIGGHGGTAESRVNTLHVQDPASVEWIPFSNTGSPIVVDRNQNVTVRCLSDGNPSPSVLLQKKTNENQWLDLPLNETFWNVTDNYWKFSYNITEENKCALRCIATNDVGESSPSGVISIERKQSSSLIPEKIPTVRRPEILSFSVWPMASLHQMFIFSVCLTKLNGGIIMLKNSTLRRQKRKDLCSGTFTLLTNNTEMM